MARRSLDYQLHSKASRAKLEPRRKAYYRQIAPNVTLGFYRRESGPGSWEIREYVGGRYKQRIIGAADDLARADGTTILTFEQAQQRATRPAPTAAVNRKLTVRQALDEYFTALEARSKHAKEARQRADKHIVPALGDVLIVRLTKTEIDRWLAGMVRDDPKDADAKRRSQDTANRTLTILKAALNLAFSDDANGIPSDTAWRRVKAFKSVDKARTDHFDSPQVRTLVTKAATFDKAFAALLEIGYLTGARLGELIAADVGDFGLASQTLSVRGKTGSRTISLTTECAQVLRKLAADKLPGAPLLPRADGERWGKSEQHRPMKRALSLAKLPASASFYSLRHSYISRSIENGMALTLIADNCGTSLRMIEKTYAKILAGTRRDMIEQHAPKLRRVK